MTLTISSIRQARFSVVFAFTLALGVGRAPAQSKDSKPSGAPRFVSRASLVLVPTVVTDRSGAHVTGLTRDDFNVLDNKQPQRISIFEEIKTAPGQIRRVDPRDAGFTNLVAPEAKNQRLTMILLDTLNTQFTDQVRARRDLLKFVDETLQANEPVALMTIGANGLNVINDFTTDPKVLSAAVKKVRTQVSTAEKSSAEIADLESTLTTQRQTGLAPSTEDMVVDELEGFQGGAFERYQQFQLNNGIEVTLRALRQIAESFSGVPGRKTLIWATGGLPFIADDPSSFDFGSAQLRVLYESAWNALNDAQITVYPLDLGGLFNPGFVSPRFRRMIRSRRAIDSISNLETLAKMTGGKLCEYKMNLSGCYNDAQKDAGQYYLIGYYTDITKGKTGWRKLEVTVQRPQVEVRARTSYYVPPKAADPKKSERTDMDTAVISPTDFTAVPMLVRWTGRTPDGSKVKLAFRFNVPSAGLTIDETNGNLISLAFAAFAKTPKGGIAGDFVKELEGKLPITTAEQVVVHGVEYDGTISVPPGQYTVRFIVRDNLSGRVGTVSVPLNAEAVAAAK
jgi:VWFA-related protein